MSKTWETESNVICSYKGNVISVNVIFSEHDIKNVKHHLHPVEGARTMTDGSLIVVTRNPDLDPPKEEEDEFGKVVFKQEKIIVFAPNRWHSFAIGEN